MRTLILYQMLQQQQQQMASKKNSDDDEFDEIDSGDEGPSQSYTDHRTVKEEKRSDNTCRVCLKEGYIPIYGSDSADDISKDLKTIIGIVVSPNDSYPKFLCSTCNMVLQDVLLLRKTAQKSEEILKTTIDDGDLAGSDNDDDNYSECDNEPSWMGSELVKSESMNIDTIKSENNMNPDWDDDDSSPFESLTVSKVDTAGSKDDNWLQYKCNKCSKAFSSFEGYNEHRMTEEHRNTIHECPICHQTFPTAEIRSHMAFHKKNPPDFICDICGMKFKSKGVFGSHRLTHSFELPFKCSLCPYRGRFKNVLKVHMRSHTGERPYLCTECPARFVHKSNLSKHLLTHREKKREFMCDPCNRGFHTKKDLELHHKVVHIGVKDHVCRICGKAFGYRGHLRRHELKVHKRAKLRSGKMPVYLKAELMKQQGLDGSCEN